LVDRTEEIVVDGTEEIDYNEGSTKGLVEGFCMYYKTAQQVDWSITDFPAFMKSDLPSDYRFASALQGRLFISSFVGFAIISTASFF
jgi:hypothetical protein